MVLEKSEFTTMNTTKFLQNARQALIPMRKAIIDALLLAVVIVVCLAFTGILFTYPWLILLIYALAYLFAAVLRLRQADRQMLLSPERERSLDEASQELSSPRTFIGLALFWGNRPF